MYLLVESGHFKFKRIDWDAAQVAAYEGIEFSITGVGAGWLDGRVVIKVPKNSKGWDYLRNQTALKSFRDRNEFNNSSKVPGPLRSFVVG